MKNLKKITALSLAALLACSPIAKLPKSIASETVVAAFSNVFAGPDNTFMITENHQLWGTGDNNARKTALTDASSITTPVKISEGVSSIVSGYGGNTFFIKTDHTLWYYGSGSYWENIGAAYRSPVKVMDHVKQVSIGDGHVLVVKTDNTLLGWGRNTERQLGLASYGSTWDNVPMKLMDDVIYVATGNFYSFIIKSDNSLWGFGANDNGQIGIGSFSNFTNAPVKIMDNIAMVSASASHTMAVDQNGNLYGWGLSNFSQVVNKDSSDAERSTITGLRCVTSPVKILDDVRTVSTGGRHTMAIRNDSSLWAWGSNAHGQFADSDIKEYTGPQKILDNVKQVSSQSSHAAAIKTDGTLWVWGSNQDGAIGLGHSQGSYTPVQLRVVDVKAIAPGIETAAEWARGGINSAFERGIISDGIQGNYAAVITRAEFCRLALRWLTYTLDKPLISIEFELGDGDRFFHTFSDTTDTDIIAAYRLGITDGVAAPASGSPGVFNPDGQFTREQAATMIMNTVKVLGVNTSHAPPADFADMDAASSWAHPGINFVRAYGIMNGSGGHFTPGGVFTRQESIVTFNNIKTEILLPQ